MVYYYQTKNIIARECIEQYNNQNRTIIEIEAEAITIVIVSYIYWAWFNEKEVVFENSTRWAAHHVPFFEVWYVWSGLGDYICTSE